MSQARHYKARILIHGSEISSKTVSDTIKSIVDYNIDDDLKAKAYKKYKRRPINLLFNTYGGSVYAGLALISAIEQSKTPVHIQVTGTAMSMGLFILAAGHKRTATRFSTIMYHQMSVFAVGKLEGVKDSMKEWKRLEKVCESYLFERTKIKSKHITPYKKEKKEWFISPEEALKLDIIDEII